ncbi:MAG: hypothetical protein COA84_02610 [Robiginitomaculum sp.]|nr:MAG: hypothetical protein COA84_02610 [Robiginitomaculum sp.]
MAQKWSALVLVALFVFVGCASKKPFRLSNAYPMPPSIKRLSEPGACQGGEALAARTLIVPKYPRFAKRQGRQGWVVAKLDVRPDGQTDAVSIKRSAPGGVFDGSAIKAIEKWQFAPVGGTGLKNCLVFIDYRLGQVRIGR